jgi:hypothetical protein
LKQTTINQDHFAANAETGLKPILAGFRILEQRGFQVVNEWMSVMPLELALGVSAHHPLVSALTAMLNFFTRLFPGLLGYQCLYELRKNQSVRDPLA